MTGADFRAARKFIGWTQVRLAKRFGRSGAVICKWEKGYSPVPHYAAEFIRMAVRLKEALDGDWV